MALNWAAVDGAVATLERKTGEGDYAVVASEISAAEYTDSGLTPGGTYTYRMKLSNDAGSSAYSEPISVTLPAGNASLPATGLRLWLRADVGVVAGSDGKVSLWADQSSLGNDAAPSELAQQPLLVANVVNGRSVVRFDGTDDTLKWDNLMAGATAGEIFIVARLKDFSNPYNGLAQFGTGYGTTYGDGMIWDDFGIADANGYDGPGSSVLTQWHLYNSAVATDGDAVLRFNGVVNLHRTGQTVSFRSNPIIGADWYGDYFRGDIAEVLVYDHVLSAEERATVNGYFVSKYALTVAGVLPTPTLTATVLSSTRVALSWTAMDGAVATVERKSGEGDYAAVATQVSGSEYIDSGLTPGGTYTYRMKLGNDAGSSAYSNEVSVTLPAAVTSLPAVGLRLWLRADVGVVAGSSGNVSFWADQSSLGNDAVQTDSASQPQVMGNQLNGQPVVRFDGNNQGFPLPDFMNGATAGEIFAVLKCNPGVSGEWALGAAANDGAYGTYYPDVDGQVRDDFGSTVQQSTPLPAAGVTSYHIYNVSAAGDQWVNRYNGGIIAQISSNTVAFRNNPTLGYTPVHSFNGDLVEVVVYDRMLSAEERATVNGYLGSKYAFTVAGVPAMPTLTATVLSSTRVALSWAAVDGAVATLERKTGEGDYAAVATQMSAAEYTDSGLTPGGTYTYRMKLSNDAGNSAYSEPVTVTLPASNTSLPDAGLRLWLRANVGVLADNNGKVTLWADQSNLGNDATSGEAAQQPQLVADVVNDRPVVRFDGVDDVLALGNVMTGANAGEIFIVARLQDVAAVRRGLTQFGNAGGTAYGDGMVWDDFGNADQPGCAVANSVLTSWHLYNSAMDANGNAVLRFNGTDYVSRTSQTVSFCPNPILGEDWSGDYFPGDIAEIIVYDHVLSAEERVTVNDYLRSKYALTFAGVPAIPTLTTTVLSSTQLALAWTAADGAVATVERKTGEGNYAVVASEISTAEYTDSGLTPGETYTYRMKLSNDAGSSAYSEPVLVTLPVAGTSVPDAGLRLWLRADVGVVADSDGAVNAWLDLSGLGNDATQTDSTQQPQLVADQLNGQSVIHFTTDHLSLLNLPNLMTGASGGEAFAVLRRSTTTNIVGLWAFGTGNGSRYPETSNQINDDFATTGWYNTGLAPAGLTEFHLYNVGGDATAWFQNFNGQTHFRQTGNTVGFRDNPTIGDGQGCYFDGDIAEVIVYDHVLSAEERAAVNGYFAARYALTVAGVVTSTDTDGDGLPDDWERQYFGTLGYGPGDDPGNVGRTLLQSYQQGLSPWPAAAVADGLRAWYRADLGVTMDANSSVSQWLDASGNGFHLVHTPDGNKPIWTANAQNGQPVMTFAGNGQRLWSEAADMAAGSTDLTVVVVMKPGTVASYAAVIAQDGSNGYVLQKDGTTADGYYLQWQRSSSLGSWAGAGLVVPVGAGQSHIVTMIKSGTTQSGYVQGTLQASGSVPADMLWGVVPMSVGGFSDSNNNSFAGQIAEVLVYNRALSAAERGVINSYLGSRYALNLAVPPAPTLTATVLSSTRVALSWAAVDGAVATLERKTGEGDYAAVATQVSAAEYIDSGLTPGGTYTYRMKLSNDTGSSDYSDPVSVTLPAAGGSVPAAGLRLWLRANVGVVADDNGKVSLWADQSSLGNDAVQTDSASQPQVVGNQLNGRPVVHFITDHRNLLNLPNLMAGASGGEAFAVLRRSTTTNIVGLWAFGMGNGSRYPETSNQINDDFATTGWYNTGPAPAGLTEFHLYNVGGDATVWFQNFNGQAHFRQTGNTVGFRNNPTIGASLGCYFDGDIAEVLVYDHVLSTEERETINGYFSVKYALTVTGVPAAPTLTATVLSSSRVILGWTGVDGAVATVERKTGEGDYAIVASELSAAGYTDSGLTPGGTYTYRAQLSNEYGSSAYSGPISITLPIASTSVPDAGLRLWLRADVGIVADSNNNVSRWGDQSNLGNDAAASEAAQQPQLVVNVVNGQPVVRFNGTNDALELGNVMAGATAGEIFIVTRAQNVATARQGLTQFGTAGGTSYGDGMVWDDFGNASQPGCVVANSVLTSWHLYNSAMDANGNSVLRFNCADYVSRAGQTVSFCSNPVLGADWSGNHLLGDIAEVLVYDHVLSAAERATVGGYFVSKYALPVAVPVAPTLTAILLSSTRVVLMWTAVDGAPATVERKTDAGDYTAVATQVSASGYVDSGLTPGGTYTYRAKLSNIAGSSAYSDPVPVTLPSAGATLPEGGLRLWLRADVGVAADSSGTASAWMDLSGLGNDATQTNNTQRPQLVANQLNGKPVLRFNGVNNRLSLPNVMTGATAGEIFIVARLQDFSHTYNGLAGFGTGHGITYADGMVWNDFGTADLNQCQSPGSSVLTQWHVCNASVSASGDSVLGFNGVDTVNRTGQTISFRSDPVIGSDKLDEYFNGDVAEVIVYDRVLTDLERQAVYFSLVEKYGVNVPPEATGSFDRDGDGVSDAQEILAGTDPNDFFNGQSAVLTLVSGDAQSGTPGAFLPAPVVVRVTKADGTPIANAPVTFDVVGGTGGMAAAPDGTGNASSIFLRTDSQGKAQVYWKLSPGGPSPVGLLPDLLRMRLGPDFVPTNSDLYCGAAPLPPPQPSPGSPVPIPYQDHTDTDELGATDTPAPLSYAVIRLLPPAGSPQALLPRKVTASGHVLLVYDNTFTSQPKGYHWYQGQFYPLQHSPPWASVANVPAQTSQGTTIGDLNDAGFAVGTVSFNYTANFIPLLQEPPETVISNQPVFWSTTTGDAFRLGAVPKSTKETVSKSPATRYYDTPNLVNWTEGSGTIVLYFDAAYTDSHGFIDAGKRGYRKACSNAPVAITDTGMVFGNYQSPATAYADMTIYTAYFRKAANFTDAGVKAFLNTLTNAAYWNESGDGYFYQTSFLDHSSTNLYTDTTTASTSTLKWSSIAAVPNTADSGMSIQAVSPSGNQLIEKANSSSGPQRTLNGSPMTNPADGPINDRGRYVIGAGWAENDGASQPLVGLEGGTALAINDSNDVLGHKKDGNTYALWTWTGISSFGNYRERALDLHLAPGESLVDLEPTINDSRVLLGRIQQNADPSSKIPALFVPAALAVDANRDGQINLANDTDLTTPDKPFRFWLNDDDDGNALNDEQEVTGGTAKDYESRGDFGIASKRDLEDFARLWLSVKGITAALKNGDLQLGLKWTDGYTGTPKINLYLHYEADGGTKYLTDTLTAAGQTTYPWSATLVSTTNKNVVAPGDVFVLKKEVFASLTEEQSTVHFLFEGAGEGKGQLQMVILDQNGALIGEGPGVWLDLKNVRDMFQRGEIASDFTLMPPTPFTPPADEAKQAIVFVHGWRTSPEIAENFAETLYKRLWHRGFKGRMAYMRWPTKYSERFEYELPVIGTAVDSWLADYNGSERIAWQCGPALKQFVESLPNDYNRNITAHSMGNIVVGSALLAGMALDNYVLMHAAVPAACYDERDILKQAERPSENAYVGVHPIFWEAGASPDDDPVPETQALAYRGRLSGEHGNLVNFYLPNDVATVYAWEFNNDQFKPASGYGYSRGAPVVLGNQQAIWKLIGTMIQVPLSDPYEAMPFACRSWSKCVGAESLTAGAIKDSFNLNSSPLFFDTEHSAEFNRNIQVLKPYYDRLIDSMHIPRNQ